MFSFCTKRGSIVRESQKTPSPYRTCDPWGRRVRYAVSRLMGRELALLSGNALAVSRYAGIRENLPGSPPREGVVRNFRWQVYSRAADKKAAQYGECEGWLKPPQGLFALYLRLDLVLLAGAGIGSFCCGGAASSTGVLSSGPSIGAALRVPASGSLSS